MAAIKRYKTSAEYYKNAAYEEDCLYLVGEKKDIKAIYKSIARNKNTDIFPLFNGYPIFADRWIYAICIDNKSNAMTIVNSDTILGMIWEGSIVETE